MSNTLIVNLFAGPGAGKSTLAAGLFRKLKLLDVNCELVTEVAKYITWEKHFSKLACQPLIFGKQLWQIERLLGQVDCIVTDSPILLSAFYSGSSYPPSFTESVIDIFKSHNNDNYFVKRNKKYNPKGRNQTEVEAKVIDKQIKNFLREKSLDFSEYDGKITSLKKFAQSIYSKLEHANSSPNIAVI